MPETDELQRIGFRTSGTWTIGDLELFSSGLGSIYDAALTVRLKRNMEAGSLELARRSVRDLEEYAPGPFAHELLYAWRRALDLWERRGTPPPFAPALSGLPFLGAPFAPPPDDQEVFDNLELYAEAHDRLRLYRLEMASPGGVNFEGLGGVIEQVRELIRDLWFRNRQDRIEGELKIIERVLDLRERHPDANLQLPAHLQKRRYLIDKTAEGVAKLKKLEEERKLLPPPENLDYEPPKSAA